MNSKCFPISPPRKHIPSNGLVMTNNQTEEFVCHLLIKSVLFSYHKLSAFSLKLICNFIKNISLTLIKTLKQTNSSPPQVIEPLCKGEAKRRPKQETMKIVTCSQREVTEGKEQTAASHIQGDTSQQQQPMKTAGVEGNTQQCLLSAIPQ